LAEQVVASAFTFFIFVVATRTLAPEALSLYTAFFSLNQSFSFFLMGLVLIPLASSTGAETGRQLGTSIVLLGFLLAGFALVAPLAMWIFDSFKGRNGPATWTVAVIFFASQCFYESARWLSIRLRGARATLPVTVARSVLFFGGLLLLGAERLDGTVFALTQVAANLAATLGYGFVLGVLLSKIELHLPDRNAMRHFATFGNSFANFATNFAAVTLIDRAWGGAGLAVFQAMRSATNPIGLVSQVIDNHFSANLAQTGQTFSYGARHIAAALAVMALLVGLAVPLGPWATALILGEGFGQWWPLFPMMLFASLAHAITRPVFVRLRLASDVRALNIYSLLLIFTVAPALVVLGGVGATQLMVLVFAAQPFACLLALVVSERHRSFGGV
jgi:hypothetical protein